LTCKPSVEASFFYVQRSLALGTSNQQLARASNAAARQQFSVKLDNVVGLHV